MGFFSRLRSTKQGVDQAQELMSQPGFADMVRQGQEMAAQMQSSGQMQELMHDSQLAMRLSTSGVAMPATIRAVERIEGGPTDIGAGGAPPGWGPAGEAPASGFQAAIPPESKVTVEVQPPGRPAYEGSFTQMLPDQLLPSLTPGAKITVRVDPNDPSAMMMWGG